MAEKASTSIFVDKYHPQKNGKCAISIRVTFQRKKRYYPTEFELLPEDFSRLMGERPRNELKEMRAKLNYFENRAIDIIRSLPYFTWDSFNKQFLQNRGNALLISHAFDEYIKVLKDQDRLGTALTHECAKSSIQKFNSKLTFSEVNPGFLKKYERWMLDAGNSVTTVGIYLRNLRTLFNNGIEEGLISKELYPFGKRKYEIPTGNNIKKALTIKDISSIFHHKLDPGTTAEKARDYWMFMYFCNGINVKDMCLLKYKNIQSDVIAFERAKTVRTKRKVEPIRVSLLDEARAIIEKWGNENASKEQFVFPVLSKDTDAERQQQLIKQLTRLINDHMKAIAKDLGITKDVTTYAARHSFASILQRSGASTEFIGEALGHSNVKTTQNYLAGFEDDHKKEMAKALTAFKNKTDE